jgi:hypothetical protein
MTTSPARRRHSSYVSEPWLMALESAPQLRAPAAPLTEDRFDRARIE